MSWQDEDIKKLKHYAKAHGLKVNFKKKNGGGFGAEYVADDYITIFVGSRTTKIDIILCLLHELGHHLDYIIRGDDSRATSEALNLLHNKTTKIITKAQRKLIYEAEKPGIMLMPYFVNYLNLNIDKKRVQLQKLIDINVYRVYMQTGRFPNVKENIQYIKKLGKRGKNKRN